MRFTPAGVPVSEGRVLHASTQTEGGGERQVTLEIAVLALGESARWLQAVPLNEGVKVTGFLAAKGRNSKIPVLHVNSLEFLEGK